MFNINFLPDGNHTAGLNVTTIDGEAGDVVRNWLLLGDDNGLDDGDKLSLTGVLLGDNVGERDALAFFGPGDGTDDDDDGNITGDNDFVMVGLNVVVGEVVGTGCNWCCDGMIDGTFDDDPLIVAIVGKREGLVEGMDDEGTMLGE